MNDMIAGSEPKEAILQRFTASLPPPQNDALNAMAAETGLSKNDLIRNAVALLNVAFKARKKGFELAVINDDDGVVGRIVSTV
jgi:hypothetical protein